MKDLIRPYALGILAAALALHCGLATDVQASYLRQHRDINAREQVTTYADVVYRNYRDAYEAALRLQQAVNDLIAGPADDANEALSVARQAWLDARMSYGQTEAYRFYGGPIDMDSQGTGGKARGIEGRLNAWPLNEAYIDAVEGNPGAGIINDPSVPITRATLVERNSKDDEADVTTGYHAIEFLLWGQDLSANGPGHRSARDFVGSGAAERRRAYLRVTADLLVDDLRTLVEAWAPNQHNYRVQLIEMDARMSLGKILTGVANLSGFELASERLATAIDSGSQEDEQSCFSDNTHVDILANAIAVENVYFGHYGEYQGKGINTLVKAANPDLNHNLENQIRASVELARTIDRPFDRTLASPLGSLRRSRIEALVKSLQIQADMLKQAGRHWAWKLLSGATAPDYAIGRGALFQHAIPPALATRPTCRVPPGAFGAECGRVERFGGGAGLADAAIGWRG